jgi:predicted flap endonuclease-1-like 5' DNA nuclease
MISAALDNPVARAFVRAQDAWTEVFEEWTQLAFTFDGRDLTPRMKSLCTAGARAQQLSLVAMGAAFGGPATVALGNEFVPGGVSEPEPAPKKANGFQALQKPLGRRDDLTKIKGLGPKMQSKLNALGVFHFWQLASLSPAAAEAMDARLRANGRIKRERWVSQAKKLTEDVAA